MKYIIFIIVVGAIIGVTFGLFSSWGWNGLVPDLILLLVIALALTADYFDYLFLSIIGGFWLDVVYGLPIGSFTIPLLVCGTISSFLIRKRLFSEIHWYHFVGAIAAATILLKLWIWGYSNTLFLFNWYHLAVSGKQMLSNISLSLIANILLAYPVYVIVEMFVNSQLRWQKHKIRL